MLNEHCMTCTIPLVRNKQRKVGNKFLISTVLLYIGLLRPMRKVLAKAVSDEFSERK